MEQTVATLNESSSLVKPTIITDITLLSPGIWTGVDNQKTKYTSENISVGFENTNWNDMNLFLDHKDNDGPAAAYWIGFIRNAKMSNGDLIGDLEIWHPLFSMFIKQAKANFGVSMTMRGNENFNTNGDYSDYAIHSFQSGSLVDEPGCETSWLPKMLSKGEKNSKTVLGGNINLEQIKALSKKNIMLDNHTSKKNLASNDTKISESSDSEKNSDEEDKNCKEVKKMTDENQTQENTEEQKEEVKTEEESKEESKDESKETDSNSSTDESEKEKVKELGAKVDKLSADINTLTNLVQKSLAAGDESKDEENSEESKDEESEDEESDKSEDTSNVEKELENTKKELAAAKAELNSPDKKTLAAGVTQNVSVEDANSGMISFLGKNANLI